MAGKGKRLPDEDAQISGLTKDQLCLLGECGPWIATDKAQFHHADVRAQQWFIRLDKEEVAELEFAIYFAGRVKSAAKWTRRCFYALGASFTAVYAFGEKLGKLPETIQSAVSGVLKTLDLLRKWHGQ